MTSIPDFLSLATSLVALALVVAAVMKVFQLASDIRELKDVLKDIRRNTQGLAHPSVDHPPVPSQLQALGQLPALDHVQAVHPETMLSQAPPDLGITQDPPLYPGLPTVGRIPTAEELVRAVHAQHFGDDEFPL